VFFFLSLLLLQRYGKDYAYRSVQGEKLLQFLCRSGGFCRLLWNAGESSDGSMGTRGACPEPYPPFGHPPQEDGGGEGAGRQTHLKSGSF